ncbi:T6SS immunity protein Tdi1 domain-containing protein [Streptomyces sp. NPDC001514]
MFQRFLESHPADDEVAAVGEAADSRLAGVEGFAQLVAMGAGRSFGQGIVRVHTAQGAARVSGLLADAFPEFADRVVPVAQDWLGRQYALDLARSTPAAACFLLFEPGTGEAFEVDADVLELFNSAFVDDPDTYLAADLHSEWLGTGSPRLEAHQCVGFKVPLFLGGEGSVENLEISDLEVYWSLCGQLRSAI